MKAKVAIIALLVVTCFSISVPAHAQGNEIQQDTSLAELRAYLDAYEFLAEVAAAGGNVGCSRGTRQQRCDCYTDRATFFCRLQDDNARKLCTFYEGKVAQLCS